MVNNVQPHEERALRRDRQHDVALLTALEDVAPHLLDDVLPLARPLDVLREEDLAEGARADAVAAQLGDVDGEEVAGVDRALGGDAAARTNKKLND